MSTRVGAGGSFAGRLSGRMRLFRAGDDDLPLAKQARATWLSKPAKKRTLQHRLATRSSRRRYATSSFTLICVEARTSPQKTCR